MENNNTTPFKVIYNRFLSKITDDLYLELTKEETERDLEGIFQSGIVRFQFPRFPLYDYDLDYEYLDDLGMPESKGRYNVKLTLEEVDIITDCMIIEWLGRQLDSVENYRMKYSGSDFKFTSQANHMRTLNSTKKSHEYANTRKQRMYKRRKLDDNGYYVPNYSGLAGGVQSGNRD